MPELLSAAEFVQETRDDFNSPTTSTFVKKIPLCRQTVADLEEMLDCDRDGLMKMKKALKAIHNSGNAHVDNEVYLSKALDKLGENAELKDNEYEIGAAFRKFAIVTKELSNLMETLMQNMKNIIMFPLDNMLKGDLKGVKGDLKKPFDKALREYESKMSKIEKEKKQQAKEAGFIKTEISPAEIAEEMDKERKLLQLQMCEYLIKVNEIKTKKGVELLSHLVDYYHAQTSYFQDGLKTIEHFNYYIAELSGKIQRIKQKQDEERRNLIELRTLLKSCSPYFDGGQLKELNCSNQLSVTHSSGTSTVDRRESKGGYSLHQIQGNKNYGVSKLGYLSKKSEGKMKVKVWQKRKCEIKDGYLFIYHSDESKSPTKVNLLTCQVKPVPDEKKCFNLVSCNRTYHFQTDDENECEAWISVLLNSKEGALKKEFDSNLVNPAASEGFLRSGNFTNQSLIELRQSVINQVLKLPGNDKCVDCNSPKDPTWLSTNFGVLLCIECSGIHRDLGVHISRIQSLTLDNIGTSQLLLARVMSNNGFNDIMEATLDPSRKLKPTSSMEERFEFIRAKYVDKKFALRSCSGDINDLKNDLEQAIISRNIYQVLQVFVEGGDLNWILPTFTENGEVSLHVAIVREDGTSLHLVDFLVENNSDLNLKTRQGNTPLHLCVLHNQSECMKLLLRSGANHQLTNNDGKTPLQLAKERDLPNLIELLEHAMNNKKTLFENVNIDWRLTAPEDVSTDFSDDDTTDDKLMTKEYYQWLLSGETDSIRQMLNGSMSDASSRTRLRKLSLSSWDHSTSAELLPYANNNTMQQQQNQPQQLVQQQPQPVYSQSTFPSRSRPSSVAGNESPSNRSNGSFKSIPSSRKIGTLFSHTGSIKKKAPVAPSNKYPSSGDESIGINSDNKMSISRAGRLYSHSRATSDTSALMHTVSQWKNISTELENTFKNDSSSETRSKIPSSIKPSSANLVSSPQVIQRPGCPPPPLPPHQGFLYDSPSNMRELEGKIKLKHVQHNQRISNGQSSEKINLSPSSLEHEQQHNRSLPIPPPRKQRPDLPLGRIKRCRALYDCEAERDDELTFKEGEIILILNEKTDDDDWMEGVIEGEPGRKGVFPTSFVQLLPD